MLSVRCMYNYKPMPNAYIGSFMSHYYCNATELTDELKGFPLFSNNKPVSVYPSHAYTGHHVSLMTWRLWNYFLENKPIREAKHVCGSRYFCEWLRRWMANLDFRNVMSLLYPEGTITVSFCGFFYISFMLLYFVSGRQFFICSVTRGYGCSLP